MEAAQKSEEQSERIIIFLVGCVQFINILDFVMVMPMGPDFSRALGIPVSRLGLIGGSYTAAAAVAGVVGSLFLDRFDRRPAVTLAMIGLVIGTMAGGFATDFPTLLAARILAGFFGGPATSLAISIIADTVPPERRGKAMGAVMGAFAAATVLGVPVGLELAERYNWRAPFLATAALGLLISIGTYFFLPSLRGHLKSGRVKGFSLIKLIRQPLVQRSYFLTAIVMMSGFLIIPNIAAYVQQNLGFPRSGMGRLYLMGGTLSFFSTRIGGRLVDKYGAFKIGTLGVICFVPVVYLWFYQYSPSVGVMPLFLGFMVAMGLRNVSYTTLVSKVPAAEERARFSSFQSAVQHLASALGAIVSSAILTEIPGGKLDGMPRLTLYCLAITALVPFLLWQVERGVEQRRAAAHPATI